ncbi:MAG: LCP family protein [Coriobacteriia bacterium]|nr:LCP family protein [Coriobacteriia bacterium]
MAKHSIQDKPSWEGSYQRGRQSQAQDWGYPDASSYSRDNYTHRRAKPRKRGAGKIILRIVLVLVALALVLGIAIAAYAHAFDSRTHESLSTPDTLSEAITPATAGQPYYILLLGSDWREMSGTSNLWENQSDNQRADVIILARMDAANKQVTLVSVPRDTRWNYNGKVYKINEAYNIGGATLQTQAISELTGVPIAHTIETHFSGIQGLVDALGGIEVDVPQTIEYKDALTGEMVTVEAGRQKLNGQEVQIFARVRKAYSDGDGTRQSNVRVIVGALAGAILAKSPLEYPALGLKIAECFGTDMTMADFMGLALDFGKGYTMYSGTGPTAGDYDEAQDGLWLCYENPEGWQRVMEVVQAGGDPSTVDPNIETENAAVEGGYYDEYGNYIENYGDYSEDYGYYEEEW